MAGLVAGLAVRVLAGLAVRWLAGLVAGSAAVFVVRFVVRLLAGLAGARRGVDARGVWGLSGLTQSTRQPGPCITVSCAVTEASPPRAICSAIAAALIAGSFGPPPPSTPTTAQSAPGVIATVRHRAPRSGVTGYTTTVVCPSVTTVGGNSAPERSRVTPAPMRWIRVWSSVRGVTPVNATATVRIVRENRVLISAARNVSDPALAHPGASEAP